MPAILPFAFASLLPVVLLGLACCFGGIWATAAVISITVFSYLLDRMTGDDWPEPKDQSGHVLSVIIAVMHFAILAGSVWAIALGDHLSLGDKVLIFIGAGLWFGQVSNSNAHELIHRNGRWARRLGIAVYCSLLFGHHASTHPKVHHVHVATDRDPNSARLGEGFYRFFARAWRGGFQEGLRAESTARARAAKVVPAWQHPFVGYILGAVVTIAVAAVLAGLKGVVILLIIVTYAQVQLFLSDYVQHYGLRRRIHSDGRAEPIGPQHSWNAPHWYSGAMMLNAPRHSDHHIHPTRAFPTLELSKETMPILPYPLPVMACIALVPNLWRRLMNPRVTKWMQQ